MSNHPPSEYAPGSINAIEAGCRCPPVESLPPNVACAIRGDCPLHGEEQYRADEQAGIEDERLAEID